MGVQLLSFTPGSFFICLTPHWILSVGPLSSFLISSSPPTFTHQIASLRSCISGFTFSFNGPKKKKKTDAFNCRKFQSRDYSVWSRPGHLPLLSAVHLLAVVSMDVEWCPNPLKAHVGTVCISFSHLGERPQPSLFTGIPCPLSVQPQPRALA